MYNEAENNHPRALNYVGYVLNIGGVRVYHAGDTERFPEMKTFAADVVMLPLNQVFTMNTVQEAVDAAVDLKARIAIPIHWGNAEGTRADAEFFAAQLTARGMQAVVNTPVDGLALEISETISIAEHPASLTVAPGGTATRRVQAGGTGALRYQWRRNGLAVASATTATLSIPFATTANAGEYEVIVFDANGPRVSRSARLAVETPQPGRLVNLSARASTRGAGLPLIVGAVAAGALRASFSAVGAFDLTDANSRDAALVTTFDAARTVHVGDTADRRGVALVEVYDTEPTGPSRRINLSARNFAGTADDTLIAGFVISGTLPKRLLIRGIGPRLATGFGVTGALADPKVELYLSEGGRSTLFAANDYWGETEAALARAAFISVGAFDLPDGTSRDAALVVTVPAGAFTAQMSGVGGATGEALIEIYELA